ncbi:MAG: aromatic amino acid ammonia-lyase, partial [Pseudomonadota bacterium]
VWSVAYGGGKAALDPSPAFRDRIEAGSKRLHDRLAAGERIYGVTTGFGESVVTEVPITLTDDLALNLVRFHGCGTGAVFSEAEAAAVVLTRAASLSAGWSGVRYEVLERLCDLLSRRVLPVIPSEGSVGASGDLTPLSYIAAVVMGEREVYRGGRIEPAAAALEAEGLAPIALAPKESLAIMNGTSVSAALTALSLERARSLARLVAALTAMASDVTGGNPAHFDARIFAAKPHPGQAQCADWIAQDIEYVPGATREGRLQDRYSIRCAPHVIGVLVDALAWMEPWIETELNGASDNPLIDPQTGEPLFGGNFYGGHACFIADGLKNAVANVADLMDRQMALLCAPGTSNGLPENLVGLTGDARAAHHGFKAMQIAASALTAEAQKLTMPASVFSRSTENHNQDKVSMSTIAARDCGRVLDLAETVAAICLITLAQAVDIRRDAGCHHRARALRDAVREKVRFNDGDRRQDGDIAAVREMIHKRTLPLDGV